MNVCGVLHDPEMFESPDSFMPERYMDSKTGIRPGLIESEYKILNELNFGCGARKCPGQQIAMKAMVSGMLGPNAAVTTDIRCWNRNSLLLE